FVSLALLKIKDKDVLDTNFIAQYLASDLAKQEIYKGSKQGTVTNLHLEEIRKFRVPLPPLSAQRKIAAILSVCNEIISLNENIMRQLRTQKRGLMQQLLTGAVRVQ